MNHPKPEEWVPYVYGEAKGAARRQLKDHLQDCAQCREEVETWKRNINRLDAWKLPRVRTRSEPLISPILNWAIAAAIVLAAGIWVGRITAPKADLEQIRQALAPELRQELAELARQEAAQAASASLASGHRYTDQVAQQLYAMVKKDVDTLAINTDAGLKQLVQLADYEIPENTANPAP